MSLLTGAGARAVEAAIAATERETAAEVVVAVVPTAGPFAGPRAACAGAWTVALALAVHVLAPSLPAVAILAAQVPVGALFYVASGAGPLLRLLVGPAAAADRAHARALQLFAERGVHRTRGATGLLVFIAERERQVVLLADRGLDRMVGGAAWEAHVAALVAGIRAGQLEAALVTLVRAAGAALGPSMPRAPGADNELGDAVLRE